MIVLSVSTLILSWENISRIWINQNNEWSEKWQQSYATNLQSEKRAAEYVIYSTALLLWLYIPRIFTESVTDRSEDQTLWLLSGVLSSVAFVLSGYPLRCLSVPYVHPRAGSVILLQLAYKIAVMVLYSDMTYVRQIPAKFRVKKGSQNISSYILIFYEPKYSWLFS